MSDADEQPRSPASTRHGDPDLPEQIVRLRRRLIRSASVAIDMLEASLHAVWNIDHLVAEQVRERDDVIDTEEVSIEHECLRLLTLQRPYAQDFRLIAFCLRVNADVERVADHATSIAKIALRLDPDNPPNWPTSLVELGDRVPVLCHALLRAVLDEDVEEARRLVDGDRVIDTLDKRLFDEITAWVNARPVDARVALLSYRMGRELERVGDLMTNIAEAVVYLATGKIIRHQRKKMEWAGPDAVKPTEPRKGLAG